MSQREFYLQLLLVSAVSTFLVWGLTTLTPLGDYQDLGWISILFFALISVGMYYLGQRAADSSNKNDFTNAVLGFIISKLLLSIAIIAVYLFTVQPASNFFVLPFFVVYLLFTIFEVSFLMKLGRTST